MIVFFLSFILSLNIGTGVGKVENDVFSISNSPLSDDDKAKKLSIGERLIENLKGENIKDYLRLITSDPHIAGTQNNKKVGEKILNLWKKNGLENVHFVEYEVLLSYPDFDNPNHISIVNRDGKILYKSNGTSPVIFPKEQGAQNAGIQWVAYSAPGEIEGEIVYCHYGRKEDFEKKILFK
uniref:Uncharacterized protein n=1 Tax=Panagrolaimus davidi TaxID=227884 RepID=A0A914PR45_9BILA